MKRKKHQRRLKTTGDAYPIHGVKSGYAFLLFQIKERAMRDKIQFDNCLNYDGDGIGFNSVCSIEREDPVDEYNNSYLKQASETFKFIMNSDDKFLNSLLISEAEKSINEIDFDEKLSIKVGNNCIHYRSRWAKYVITIYRNNRKVTIGRYETLEQAEEVYEKTIGKTLSEIVDSGLTNIANL